MTKTETIIIEEILNTVPNVGFKSPFLSSQIVNFILTPFQVPFKKTIYVIIMSHRLKFKVSTLYMGRFFLSQKKFLMIFRQNWSILWGSK